MGDLPYERLIIGVSALAAMEGAYAATLDYVRERKAFGQPIAEFQNTKFKLAEIATHHQGGPCLHRPLRRGTGGRPAGHRHRVDGQAVGHRARRASVIDECLQLFGGYGYMNEYLVARMYTDARIQRIFGGTSEIMKEVISRAL
jgi:acyl-CoA dehydrogenase